MPPPPQAKTKQNEQQIHKTIMNGPMSPYKRANIKRPPPVAEKKAKGYKMNPLIAGETKPAVNKANNVVDVVDETPTYHGYRAAKALFEKTTNMGTVVNHEGKKGIKGSSKELPEDNQETGSGNVLLVRNPGKLRYAPQKNEKNSEKSQKSEHLALKTTPNYKKLEVVHAGKQEASDENVEEGPGGDGQSIHITEDVPCYNLRAQLRKTGQIEETSGLHKHDVRRQHMQVVIDVK